MSWLSPSARELPGAETPDDANGFTDCVRPIASPTTPAQAKASTWYFEVCVVPTFIVTLAPYPQFSVMIASISGVRFLGHETNFSLEDKVDPFSGEYQVLWSLSSLGLARKSIEHFRLNCEVWCATVSDGQTFKMLGGIPLSDVISFHPARMASRISASYAESLICKSARFAVVRSAFGISATRSQLCSKAMGRMSKLYRSC